MAYALRLFDDFDTANQAVDMLIQRKYPAANIAVVFRDGNHRLRRLDGAEVEEGDPTAGMSFSFLTGWLTNIDRHTFVDDLGATLLQVGAPPAASAALQRQIEGGKVLVSVATEDFRVEDVDDILDDASGKLLTHYEELPDDDPRGVDVSD